MTDAPTPPLRDRLIDAGCALLAEGGAAALTLRRCAARAGVSHAAPAHHFDGLPGLLRAIAERGFTRFADMMEAERDRAPAAPRAKLHAICRGYLAFALENDALFTLMFRKEGMAGVFDASLAHAAERASAILTETCAPFVPDGVPAKVIEVQVWSLIHGYAFLAVSDRIEQTRGANGYRRAVPFEDVMTLLDRIGEDRP